MMAALRKKPPGKLGSIVFKTVRDYKQHEIRSLPSNSFREQLPKPSGDLLILEGSSADCQVTLAGRPSGTEPKIKFYLFANTPAKTPLVEAKTKAQRCLSELEASLKAWLTAETA